jgi:hypothetical protein
MSMIGDFIDISLERVDAVNRSHQPPAESEQRLLADIGGQPGLSRDRGRQTECIERTK